MCFRLVVYNAFYNPYFPLLKGDLTAATGRSWEIESTNLESIKSQDVFKFLGLNTSEDFFDWLSWNESAT
jgi:hypothetical protein